MEDFTIGNVIELIFGGGILGFLYWIYVLNRRLADKVWQRFDDHKKDTSKRIEKVSDKLFQKLDTEQEKNFARYVAKASCKIITENNETLFKEIRSSLKTVESDMKKILSKSGK